MTESSRRRFMIGGLVAVAGTGVAGCSSGGSESGSVVTPIAAATPTGPVLTAVEVGEWDKLVGNTFLISGESGKVSATLASLEHLPTDPNRPIDLARREPFYAYFQMDKNSVPTGGKTYQLSHATKGVFDLFLGMPSEVQGKGVVMAVLA
jgi:hypothetical protein